MWEEYYWTNRMRHNRAIVAWLLGSASFRMDHRHSGRNQDTQDEGQWDSTLVQMSLRQTLTVKHNHMCLALEMHVCHFWRCLDEVHTLKDGARGNICGKEREREKERKK